MKFEKILSMLDTPEDIENLKVLLKEEIRKEFALKTNTKQRVTNMAKVQADIKDNLEKYAKRLKNDRSINYTLIDTSGCGLNENNKYVFTDTYRLFLLNDNLGYEVRDDYVKVSISNTEDKILLTNERLAELFSSIKTKQNFQLDAVYSYDYKYLDTILKIMGECQIYSIYQPRFPRIVLYFINNDGEESVLAPIKNTKGANSDQNVQ